MLTAAVVVAVVRCRVPSDVRYIGTDINHRAIAIAKKNALAAGDTLYTSSHPLLRA